MEAKLVQTDLLDILGSAAAVASAAASSTSAAIGTTTTSTSSPVTDKTPEESISSPPTSSSSSSSTSAFPLKTWFKRLHESKSFSNLYKAVVKVEHRLDSYLLLYIFRIL